MKKLILYISLIIITFGWTSCKKVPLSNGPVVTEMRQLSDFSEIHIFNNIEVILIQSDTTKVEVTAGANLMENIITSVDGKILTIKNENKCNWIRSFDNPLTAKLYYKNIHNIEYESVGGLCNEQDTLREDFSLHIADGSGEIKLNVNCRALDINFSHGTCDVILQGSAQLAGYYQRSYGLIHAENLIANTVNVTTKGTNDCYVHCTKRLIATISSIGNIYYHGQPDSITLDVKPDARGKLISF